MRWLLAAHEKEIPNFQAFAADDWQPHSVGVGQFAALAGFAAMLANDRPSAVLLVGTAGALEAGSVGELFTVQHFAYPSIAGEDLPEFLQRAFTCEPAVALVGFSPATVVQNHGVSINPEKFIANTGYIPQHFPRPALENMEATCLAQLCLKFGIPFTALLAVTNTFGTDARAQWQKNFRQAGENLSAVLQQVIR